MKKMGFVMICLLAIDVCGTPKLFTFVPELPAKMGLRLINDSKIIEVAWQNLVAVSDSFIAEYNKGERRFELYSTDIDSNSIRIEFRANNYVTKSDQTFGLLVTIVGIFTPVGLIASGAPIWVAFWYAPKNYTRVYKSFSKDLEKTGRRIPQVITTYHNWETDEQQIKKQKTAYYYFLLELMDEIQVRK